MDLCLHLSSSLALCLILVLTFSLHLQAVEPLSPPYVHVDLVVVLHDDGQENNKVQSYGYHSAYIDMVKRFAKHFTVAENKTRVAVVGVNETDTYDVLLPLTNNSEFWSNALSNSYSYNAAKHNSIQDGLKTAREEVFKDQQTSGKPRVVLVSTFTNGYPDLFGTSPRQEVAKLNDLGMMLVMVVSRKNADSGQQTNVHNQLHDIFTHDYMLEIPRFKEEDADFIKKFSEELPDWIKKKVIEKFCVFNNDKCFFNEKRECTKGGYTPSIPLEMGDCGDPPAGSTIGQPCEKQKCEATCDELWPREEPCEGDACYEFEHRVGMFKWRQLEHCPSQYTPEIPPEDPPYPDGGDGDNGGSHVRRSVVLRVVMQVILQWL